MIDKEVAREDFERFISALRIDQLKRGKLEEEEESIISLIENGNLIVNEDGSLIYKLMYPESTNDQDGNPLTTHIEFPIRRIRVEDLEKKMIGKNDMEKTRRIFSFITKTSSNIFSKIDSDDYKYCSDIVAFFLPR